MKTDDATDLAIPVGPEDHAQGVAGAALTLVEYGDYECSYCGRAYPIVKAVQRRLGGRLRFVFRNMPLAQIHRHAEIAAEAAEAAGQQGKFWEMHDALYEHQHELAVSLVVELATKLGLDVSRFEDDLRLGRMRDRVRHDYNGGVRSGVSGTPTFFINGTRFDGDWTDVDAFLAALLRALPG
jgi:protein-disulfide isomerase